MCQLGKLLKVGDILLDDIQQLAGADHRFHRTDVGPDLAVDLVEGDLGADVLVEGLVQRGQTLAVGVQAAADVDGLAGGQQLVGEDVLRVLQDHLGLTGSGGTHGDDILLVGGGGDGVDGRGMRVDLVLADHGGGGVLDDHEAGVDASLGGQERGQAVGERGVDHTLGAALGSVGQLARGDAEEVERQGHGLAMEVAAGDNRLNYCYHQHH